MNPSIRSVSKALALSLVIVAGCDGASPVEDVAETDDALRTTYGDLVETLPPEDLDRWLGVRRALRDGFDASCSDSLCKGAYANLTSVRLACSSTRVARKLKDCVWVLGANIDHVDAASGTLTSDVHVWTCHVPVAGSAKATLDALETAGAEAFHTPLPGTGASFADALAACLDGAVAGAAPVDTKGTFAELGAELWVAGDAPGALWADTRRKLNAGFDDACGDSFCEGDYPDISGLGFSCAVDRTNAHVATCSWSFASAVTGVDSRGHITAGTKTTVCEVPIDAQTVNLTGVLTVDDPIHAPLPDRETSIYDALIACL